MPHPTGPLSRYLEALDCLQHALTKRYNAVLEFEHLMDRTISVGLPGVEIGTLDIPQLRHFVDRLTKLETEIAEAMESVNLYAPASERPSLRARPTE